MQQGPFEITITSPIEWLQFISDRLGKEKEESPEDAIKIQRKEERAEYDTYMRNIWTTGFAKFPKMKDPASEKYKDVEAAKGKKLTPLAHLWIEKDKQSKREPHQEVVKEQNDEDLSHLCKLIVENLDFELKFHIICMIPTFSTIDVRRVCSSNNVLDTYFKGYENPSTISVNDSLLVTYHKYRLISKMFNTRMQQYMMSPGGGCDTLNLVNMFSKFYNSKNQTFDLEVDLDQFFSKISHLLCFINSKKLFLSKKVPNFEEHSIYTDVDKVASSLRTCYFELFKLKMDPTSCYVINGSLPFYKVFHHSRNDEYEDEDEVVTKKNSEEKSEDENLIGENSLDDLNVPAEIESEEPAFLDNAFSFKDENKEEEELTEETLINDLNTLATTNNISTAVNYTKMFKSSSQIKEAQIAKLARKFGKEPVKTGMDTSDSFTIEFENNALDESSPREIYSKNYEKAGSELPNVYNYSVYQNLSPFTIQMCPIYNYESYFCASIRNKVKEVLPDLFSDFYAENYTLFKSVTLFGFNSWNGFNNLLLHILLENGKTVPDDVVVSEDTHIFGTNGIEEINFVNYSYDQMITTFCNDRSFNPSHNYDESQIKDSYTLKGKKYYDDISDSLKKQFIQSSIGNNVTRITLFSYGDYMYSVGADTLLLNMFFPYLTSINYIAKTRENSTPDNQMTNIHNSSEADLRDMSKYFYPFKKLVLLSEGKAPVTIGATESKAISGDDSENQDTTTKPVTSVMFTENTEPQVLEKATPSQLQTVYVRVMLLCQMSKDNIIEFCDRLDIKIELYQHLINSYIVNSPGLSVASKKELIDYLIKHRNAPLECIDLFSYDYTEELRVFMEYLAYHANAKDGKFYCFDNLIYDASIYMLAVLIYFGWDVFKNPQTMEQSLLAIQSFGKNMFPAELDLYHPLYDLFMAKLIYENCELDMFVSHLKYKCKFPPNNLFELVQQVELELSDVKQKQPLVEIKDMEEAKTRQALQQFFTHLSRPKQDVANFSNQVVTLNPDKIFVMLILAIYERDMRKVDTIFALGSSIKDFQEVFNKKISVQLQNRTQGYYSADTTRATSMTSDNYTEDQLTLVESNLLLTNWQRRTAAMRRAIAESLNSEHVYSVTDLDNDVRMDVKEKLEVNILNFLLASDSVPLSLVLMVLERMTPESLLFQDNFGNTCLHLALIQLFNSEKLYDEMLGKQPALINMANYDLQTPLHYACFQSTDNLFLTGSVLVKKYGADTDVLNCMGMTPYEVACVWVLRDLNFSRGKNQKAGLADWNCGDYSWLKPTKGLTKKQIWAKMLSK